MSAKPMSKTSVRMHATVGVEGEDAVNAASVLINELNPSESPPTLI
jgi:hypothetical protein